MYSDYTVVNTSCSDDRMVIERWFLTAGKNGLSLRVNSVRVCVCVCACVCA